MLQSTIINIIEDIWPMLLIISIVVSSLRISYLYINHKPFVLYKELIMLGFGIYIMCLFYVVTFQDVSWSTSNYIPFKEMLRYNFGSKLFFKNVIGNMLMFLPYGFFISYILKLHKPLLMLILTIIASSTIEITQLLIGRVIDIDDIFLNILGGIGGFYLYQFIFIFEKHLPKYLKNKVIYNILILAIMISVILYLLKFINIGV